MAVALDANQHVAGLDVAVHDAVLVGVLKGGGDLADDVEGERQRDGQDQLLFADAADGVCQRPLWRVLHHEVEQVLFDAAVMHGQDVGMRKLAEQRRLALEAARHVVSHLRVEGRVVWADDLDGDEAIAQPALLGEIHLAHAARAQFAEQLAAAQLVPFQIRHRAPPIIPLCPRSCSKAV